MEIPAALVRELREKSGAGIMECKKALVESSGDVEKALEILRRRGLVKAMEKKGRPTSQGKVASYIHAGGKIGVLVEVNCETDFVANTQEFTTFVRDLAMHIAAANPRYMSREDVPPEVLEKERQAYRTEGEGYGRNGEALESFVQDRLERFFSEVCLLDQPFIRDQGITVKELLARLIARVGENVTIRRFARYRLDEDNV